MKYLTHFFIFLAAISVGVASGAPGKAQGKGPKTFDSMDKDGDHKLTKEELASAPKMSEDFDNIDSNKDGSITEDELTAYRAAHQGQRMSR
jgi:Ca2+-binding EF-hand superfamily protein